MGLFGGSKHKSPKCNKLWGDFDSKSVGDTIYTIQNTSGRNVRREMTIQKHDILKVTKMLHLVTITISAVSNILCTFDVWKDELQTCAIIFDYDDDTVVASSDADTIMEEVFNYDNTTYVCDENFLNEMIELFKKYDYKIKINE